MRCENKGNSSDGTGIVGSVAPAGALDDARTEDAALLPRGGWLHSLILGNNVYGVLQDEHAKYDERNAKSAFRRGAAGSTRAASPPSVTSFRAAMPRAGNDDTTLDTELDVLLEELDNAVKATQSSMFRAKTSRVCCI